MTENEKLAELLFGDVKASAQDMEDRYPQRDLPAGAKVTRFAPSPTGFLHIGGLFAAMTAKLASDKSGGAFYIRIEDTDKKREIKDGVSELLKGLGSFGITSSEGVISYDCEKGIYGPYQQSKRRDIYQVFAKQLVSSGLAYPCFCTPDELSNLRAEQESAGVNKGYYGQYAKCRELSLQQIEKNLKAEKPYTLRLRSLGDESKKIVFEDLIKGRIEMPENIQDIVLLKADGIPTYHFAHVVDDHLMRSTLIVRGDEWISSVPVHIQLFGCCGFKVPKYAHIAPIMKEENGGKRKLSKRKDPEASVSYYLEKGYPKESVTEYLLTLANSNFEQWRTANLNEDIDKFPFNLKKMSASGALFDLNKLEDVSKNVISKFSADEVLFKVLSWARENDGELFSLLDENKDYAKSIFSIDRGGKKPRKDIAKWNEVKRYLEYFYDELYNESYELPENIGKNEAARIIKKYLEVYSHGGGKEEWFDKIKDICLPLGYTPNIKEYKESPHLFKGHVGDVSSVIRIAVTSRKNTPDLHAIMTLLGEDKVTGRLKKAIDYFKEEI